LVPAGGIQHAVVVVDILAADVVAPHTVRIFASSRVMAP
jgi:hypothetical protein